MPGIFIFWQLPKSPRRQERHVLSWPPCQPTPTRCPFFQAVTPSPSASITPATSCPGARGYSIPGHAPSFVSTSLWHTPQACTLMSTCPAGGLGISRSTISKSAPGLGTTATFIVAMNASYELLNFKLENKLVKSHGLVRREPAARTDEGELALPGSALASEYIVACDA